MVILVVLLLIFLVIGVYMVKEAFENNVLHHEIELKGNDEILKLFFISDIHVRKISKKLTRKLPKDIDLVIIGGDFADKRTPQERIIKNLNVLKQFGPVYFVWGNNDREIGEELLRQIMKENEIKIIENNAFLISTTNQVWISATDDTSSKNVLVDKALQPCGENDFVIFISHDPNNFKKVEQYQNIFLLLGGHWHGGQLRFGSFGIYPHGSFVLKDGVATLISNGYGTSLLPLRFCAKPQCHIIDVKFRR